MSYKFYNFDGTFIKDTDYVRKNFTGISVDFFGAKSYYKKGKLHRTDGPAVEHANGTKEWYIKGRLHRVGSPAIEWADGSKEWWIDGKQVTELQCKLLHDMMNLKGLLK